MLYRKIDVAHRWISLLLLVPISAWSFDPSVTLEYCQQVRARPLCAIPSSDSGAEAQRNLCRIKFEGNSCQDLLNENPDLQGKTINCDAPLRCSFPISTNEFGKICYDSFKETWKDLGKGVAGFLFGNQTLSETVKKREEYLKKCDDVKDVKCKYEMLGSFASMFSAEEIEGLKDKSKLDPGNPAHQNSYYGLSATALYRKLLVKLKDQNEKGLLTDNFIEPWSGRPARLPKNFQELMDGALAKMGVTHTECFDPAVLAEMRCYALFSVLDPAALVGGAIALKVLALAGRTARLDKLIAKSLEDVSQVPSPMTVYNEVLEQKMKRVKVIAERKKFDQDPYVQTVSNKIGAGRKNISYFDKNVSLNAETLVDGDKFTVNVKSVKANPGIADFLGVTQAGREAGLNSTLAKTFYSTIKGASLAAKANPAVRVVSIRADRVLNSSLKRNLSEMGFVSADTHLPLTEQQIISGAGHSLIFELPVDKLAALGY